jgi:hypothetical protein
MSNHTAVALSIEDYPPDQQFQDRSFVLLDADDEVEDAELQVLLSGALPSDVYRECGDAFTHIGTELGWND